MMVADTGRMTQARRWPVGRGAAQFALWLVVLVVILPLIWTVLSSIKPDSETSRYPPSILPHTITLSNYVRLFQLFPFGRFYLNSVGVCLLTTVITVLIATLSAYSITRFRTKLGLLTGMIGLAGYMLPAILVAIPVYTLAHTLNGVNSLPALAIVYVGHLVPFGLWQLRPWFSSIPHEIEEAATVDGANRLQNFFLVILPQVLPGIVPTAIYAFGISWNEYLFASLLLYTPSSQTLNSGMAPILLGATNTYSWGVLMAAAVLMIIPVLAVFIVLQRRLLVGGLTAGAVVK